MNIDRKIKALEYALQYVPGTDDNHSHSVLLEMLDELRQERGKDRTSKKVRSQVLSIKPGISTVFSSRVHNYEEEVDHVRQY